MSEQGQEDADPNVNFKKQKQKLFGLIDKKKFDEAIEFLNRLTSQNKTTAVNHRDGYNWTTLMLAAKHGAPLTFIQRLCEIDSGKPLITAENKSRMTALHYACKHDDPNIDIVKHLVQNGGIEFINKKDENGITVLEITKGKGNDSIYNFLKDAFKFPFHALCSSVDVTASKIQEYLDQNEPSCVFQTNHVSKTPLHNLCLNLHAPSDAIEMLIKEMLQTEPTGEFDSLKLKMNMAQDSTIAEVVRKISQDPTITDNVLLSLSTDGRNPSSLAMIRLHLDIEGEKLLVLTDKHASTVASLFESEGTLDDKMWLYSCIHRQTLKFDRSDFRTDKGRLEWDKVIQRFSFEKISEMPKGKSSVPLSQTSRLDITQHLHNVQSTDIINDWVSFIKDLEQCPTDSILWFAKIKGDGRRSVQEVAHEDIKNAIMSRTLFMGQYRLANGSLHKSDTAEVMQAFDQNAQIQYRKIYSEFISESNGAKKGLSFDDFTTLLNKVPEVRYRKKLEKDFEEVFHNLDADKSEMIDEGEWVDYCMGNEDNGEGRTIKFMKKKEQFEKERDRFKDGEGAITDGVVNILQAFDATGDSPEDNFFAEAMKEETKLDYEYAIVMPSGDRNLDAIHISEQPTELQIRTFLKDICECISVLHGENLIHGDLKMTNVVRFSGRMKLIDLDASANVDSKGDKDNAENYNGSKVSSGIMPPEMIHTFKDEGEEQVKAFESYYKDEKDNDPALWKKIKPRHDIKNKKSYAVKTFLMERVDDRYCGQTRKVTKVKGGVKSLPYTLVHADTSQDMWALGVMIYALLTGEKLFPVDKNEDLVSAGAYSKLATWDDTKKKIKLLCVTNPHAKKILMMLLSKDPKDRGCIADVLNHKFLEVDSKSGEYQKLSKMLKQNNEIQKQILKNTHYIRREIKDGAERTMNAVFEATDVDTPTCFVLLPYEVKAEDPSRDFLQEAQDFVERIEEVFDEPDGLLNNISEKIVDVVLGKRKKMYLYLIDEHTGTPVSHGKYPLEIELASEKMKKWAPVMLVGWRGIFLLNGTAAVASMFHPGIPVLNNGVLKKIEDKIKNIKTCGSGLIDKAIESAKDVKNVRGAQLREFSEYLLNQDKEKTFAGLCRVCNYESGNAMWVTEASKELLKKDVQDESGWAQQKNELELQNRRLEEEKNELVQQMNELQEKSELSQQMNSLEQEKNPLEEEKNDLAEKKAASGKKLKKRFMFNR